MPSKADIPNCFVYEEGALDSVMNVANVTAANCSATNGQVFDAICDLCSGIIRRFPRHGDCVVDELAQNEMDSIV